MKDFDFVPEPKWLKIGKRKFDVSRISAWRVQKAIRIHNTKFIKCQEESEALDYLIEAALILFKIDFNINKLWDWFTRFITGKRYILKNLDWSELNNFIEEALEPILGPKKKAREHQRLLQEVELEMLKTMSKEDLAELLRNLLQSPVGQEMKYSI